MTDLRKSDERALNAAEGVKTAPQPSRDARPAGGQAVGEVNPAPEKAGLHEPIPRRAFFSWMLVGWGSFFASLLLFKVLFLEYFFPRVLFEPPQTFKAGFPGEYAVGEVSERWKDAYGVWLVRTKNEIYALSTVCTHLGCTPNWLPSERKFKCPCHGSGFFASGVNFEGPAPRPLERFKIALADDGQILIDKTQKFQAEKGEWDDPESRLVV
jgi:cytochrome b6-f complex iron-sulfur subunit